jgi:hypothetical protein
MVFTATNAPTSCDLITLADLDVVKHRAGTERDEALQAAITSCSRAIEAELGRRVRYRGPATVAELSNIVASRTLQNESVAGGSITQPAAPGRTLIVIATDADRSLSAGTVTITGTVNGVAGTKEIFDLSWGLVQHGLLFFTAITAIDVAVAGNAAGDTLRIGSSAGYTEYHTPTYEPWVLLPYEWPVASVLELNEDPARAYPTSLKLVAGTDFQLTVCDGNRMERSSLIRLYSSMPGSFVCGYRAERLINSAGYAASAVPTEIRDACRRLVLIMDDEVEHDRVGMTARSDPSGNYTRYAQASITPEIRRAISQYKRRTFGTETGERDFALADAA